MKYPELKGKCKECYLKCFRVESPEFEGILRCDYFTEEEKEDEQIQIRNR